MSRISTNPSAALKTPDLQQAPPSFRVGTNKVVFSDILRSDVDVTFDVSSRQAKVKATVVLEQPEEGSPVLDLVPAVSSVKVDGEELPVSAYAPVKDPDGTSQLRVIQQKLPPGKHTVELEYTLSEGVSFDSGGVQFEIDMTDLRTRGYLEKYFPAGYEYDQHPTRMKLRIAGASHEHRVFSNGAVQKNNDGSFSVEFPEYFTASSHFLHVVDPSKYAVVEDTFEGKSGPIPLTLYGRSASVLDSALKRTRETLQKMEDRFGAYPHPAFTANITSGGMGGGMEYSGATKSSLNALAHEINHSWFARGMMPSSGNTGWLDEAIASWGDNGYPRASGVSLGGSYPALASFSKYRRDTTQDAYTHGARVLAELDYLLRDKGGLTPVLSELYKTHVHETITTELFLEAVSRASPEPLDEYFRKKIYGGRTPGFAGVSPSRPNDEWFIENAW